MALQVKTLTFNPYQENTYLVWDETGEGVIIDPGCYSQPEENQLLAAIQSANISLKYLINTHGHIDHMLGNAFVKAKFDLPFLAHQLIQGELDAVPGYAPMMGLTVTPSPTPDQFLEAGDTVSFGNTTLEVRFTPGHSPSHVSLIDHSSQQIFSGDVLFQGSIGRTDLPGGDMDVLMHSIFNELLPLGDAYKVWPGHGPATTLGRERVSNYYLLQRS